MAVDMFLKIEGIPGESKDKTHPNEIQIDSFSWGASNPSSVTQGSGLGAGKVSISSLNFMKRVDKSSTLLFKHCCDGKHITKTTLTCRKAGGDAPVEYLIYELTDCMIDATQNSGASGGDEVSESITLSATQIKMTYWTQDEKGAKKDKFEHGWNQKENAAAA